MSESTFLQDVAEKEEPNAKKSKNDEASGKEKETSKAKTKANSETPEAPKDYIHVRARRGQATDSHSLAERVCLNSMLCSVDLCFFFFCFGIWFWIKVFVAKSCLSSLPGQVRREKISERMKFLQDLVPGCNKVPKLFIFEFN